MRLDKILSHMGFGSRKDVKKILKKNRVKINDQTIVKGDYHVDLENEAVYVDGQLQVYNRLVYLMLNKPQNVVSATEDNYDDTVIDLLAAAYQKRELFPVGRLDKDTEGLLILTNDGQLGHLLTSPKHAIEKVYYACIDGEIKYHHIKQFESGVTLNDGYQAKPAKLNILTSSEGRSEIEITVTEGKFHQVKRMFEAIDRQVIYLKRIQMGNIFLDPLLKLGQYRQLNKKEMDYLHTIKTK